MLRTGLSIGAGFRLPDARPWVIAPPTSGVDLCRTTRNPVLPIPVTQPSIALHASARYPMAADSEASLGSSAR